MNIKLKTVEKILKNCKKESKAPRVEHVIVTLFIQAGSITKINSKTVSSTHEFDRLTQEILRKAEGKNEK